MKPNCIHRSLILLIISVASCFGEIYSFPKGSKPSVSMLEAIRICGKCTKNSVLKSFNPTEATIRGGEMPGSGAWSFRQHEKDGSSILFVVYFPEKVCFIFDEAKGMKIISTHRHDGSPIPELEANAMLQGDAKRGLNSDSFSPIPTNDTPHVREKDPFESKKVNIPSQNQ